MTTTAPLLLQQADDKLLFHALPNYELYSIYICTFARGDDSLMESLRETLSILINRKRDEDTFSSQILNKLISMLEKSQTLMITVKSYIYILYCSYILT